MGDVSGSWGEIFVDRDLTFPLKHVVAVSKILPERRGVSVEPVRKRRYRWLPFWKTVDFYRVQEGASWMFEVHLSNGAVTSVRVSSTWRGTASSRDYERPSADALLDRIYEIYQPIYDACAEAE